MPLVDERTAPLARCYLWKPGQADPVVQVPVFAAYDTIGSGFLSGSVTTTGGEPELQYLSPVGLVLRPFLTFQDTRLTHYTTSGGAWDERYPGTGAYRFYRLVQYDTTAGEQWSATSSFTLPKNPSVAFSLSVPDSPPDWDESALPPYVRIEFGGERWAIELSKTYGNRLLRKVSGSFVPVMDLPGLSLPGNSEADEGLIVLRCHRGLVGVSMDAGQSYNWHLPLDAPNPTVPAGLFTLRGQGGMAVWGVHQLVYHDGAYTAPARNMFWSRSVTAVPTLDGTDSNANGGTITYSDLSVPLSAVAQWRVTLTAGTTVLGGPAWTHYHSPEVYGVLLHYEPELTLGSGLGFKDLLPDCTSVLIDKPQELDAATGEAEFRLDPDDTFLWEWGRDAKIQVDLGHVLESGAEEFTTVLVGFVTEPCVHTERYRDVRLSLRFCNVSHRFKRARWTRLNSYPLGGRTLNQALDRILADEGVPLNVSYRHWHTWGDYFVLPFGSPEDPFEWPRPGESKWDTMQRLAGYAGLEVVPTDDGVLRTLPLGYFSPDLKKTLAAVPESNLVDLVMRLNWRWLHGESVNLVMVHGVDSVTGAAIMAWAFDSETQNPTSTKYMPYVVSHEEIIDGTCTPGMLAARASVLAQRLFRNFVHAEILNPVDLEVGRTDQNAVSGFTNTGIQATDRWVVRSIRHRYSPTLGKSATEVSAEILPAGSPLLPQF